MQTKDEKYTDLIKKLAQKKAKIEHKEKLLRDKERKMKIRRLIEVGSIAAKFGIAEFDDQTLAGAFAEMEERSKQQDTINAWKEKGVSLTTVRLSPIIISFEKEISDEVKALLKERKFKWNSFRKEWYGHGIQEEIEKLVKEFHGKVDIAKG